LDDTESVVRLIAAQHPTGRAGQIGVACPKTER
jgi:hypothetical protein